MITKRLYRLIHFEKDGRKLHRIYIKDKKKGNISPWHDINLLAYNEKDLFPAVVTLSRYNIAHFEMNPQLEFNPLEQVQVTNPITGKLENQFFRQFPNFNYAFLPQTWNDPTKQDIKYSEYTGDGQPIGVIDLGDTYMPIGHTLGYRIIGGFCMCVHGRFASWKMLGIPHQSPFHDKVKNLKEYEQEYPGKIDAIVQWFERASALQGDNPAFKEGPIEEREFALKMLEDGYKGWKKLKLPEYKANFNYWMREEVISTALVLRR
ncbi:unnamed protein product [Blepharisma stoltei]|uniref:inorganic diphosphatase n=1 Tax=Blepharisma stoltei TaxID=1481888 RepID=A0AAU9IJE8_9CILI|nr:unnamed protein product [Blepharisma stoltei]